MQAFNIGSYYPDRTITQASLAPDQRFVAATIHTLSEGGDGSIRLMVKSTENGKSISNTRLDNCGSDVRHLEVDWQSTMASVVCGNGRLIQLEVESGKIAEEWDLGRNWQSTSELNVQLWTATHAFSPQHSLFFAASEGGIGIWQLKP